jgi:hypothetical protein
MYLIMVHNKQTMELPTLDTSMLVAETVVQSGQWILYAWLTSALSGFMGTVGNLDGLQPFI